MKTVEEILRTLTLEEKASLCQGATFWTTKAIPEKDKPITVHYELRRDRFFSCKRYYVMMVLG